MRLPTLAFAEARRIESRFVDLRSPSEFARDHVPGATNVPLFDDQQRAVVGAVYRNVSPAAAAEAGLAMVEARLPELLGAVLGRDVPWEHWRRRFEKLADGIRRNASQGITLQPARPGELGARPLVLSCWRGGMRSRAVAALLRALGEESVAILSGGYKSYRMWVRGKIHALDPETPLIVLRGPTGVGKTRLLHLLEAEEPGSTLDLEGMACHRSSILGDVGLAPATTLGFESALADRLERLGPPPWFVEGESRRVGDVVLPEALYRAMETGAQVRLDASLEHRVRLLVEDYLPGSAAAAQMAERLPFLEQRLGAAWIGRLRAWLAAGRAGDVARVLLESYYDPRYAHCDRRRVWTARLRADDPEAVPRLLQLRSTLLSPCVDSSASPA